jgi:hypothetical protein
MHIPLNMGSCRAMARRWVRRPQSRLGGCLLVILLFILVLIVLSVLFGGFQKGTKVNGMSAVDISRPVGINRPVGISRWCDASFG